MNATALVLKATHYKTTVQDSPSVFGWEEEDIKEKGREEFWRFDVDVLVKNISEKNLVKIKCAYLTGKGICLITIADKSSKVLTEVLIPNSPLDGLFGGHSYEKFFGLPGSNISFRWGSEIEMELSFGFYFLNAIGYEPNIISNYDEYFGAPIPLTIIVYMECTEFGVIRTRLHEEKVTTNFISYPKDG